MLVRLSLIFILSSNREILHDWRYQSSMSRFDPAESDDFSSQFPISSMSNETSKNCQAVVKESFLRIADKKTLRPTYNSSIPPNFPAFSSFLPIQVVPFRNPLKRLKSRRLDRTKSFHAQRQNGTLKTSFKTGDNVRGPCSDRPRFRNVLAPSRRLGRLRVGDDGGCCWELSSRGASVRMESR